MGSYASKPITDKESENEFNERLKCGASSMQGWRVTQEDAHNCLLDYDTYSSYFAVYDGHGGHDVAQYCSQKLPEYIKSTQAYKDGDVEKALIDGFLGFDQTITTPEVIASLKEIAMSEEAIEDGGSDDEENVNNLYEEALMPIERVIEKYTSNLINPNLNNLKKSGKLPKSPLLKAKTENGKKENEPVSSSDIQEMKTENEEAGPSSSSISNDTVSSSSSGEKNDKNDKSEGTANVNSNSIPTIKITSDDGNEVKTDKEQAPSSDSVVSHNGDASLEKEEVTSSSVQENGTPKGKGKAKMVVTPVTPTRASPRLKSAEQLYKKLLDFTASQVEDEDDTEDEEDVTFDGAQECSDDDDDDDENVKNAHLEEGSDDSSADEEEDDEDNEDDDDNEDDEDDDKFTREMKDEPGFDSGCTAVVALLKDKKLWVANAGDSRCVVCRNGKAIEMSFDHKPEDKPERERINKAGGHVSADGRVNNGLNLSRAIGDHAYKLNTELGPREQMITALPDIKTLEISDEDEFMILACDGIWNFMTSQEVVDYIRPKIQEDREKLSSICEELFDHCLAPDTMGDGTGCDNMTAIIVQFKANRKRLSSETVESETNKKLKTVEPETTV